MRNWREFAVGLVLGAVGVAALLAGYFWFGFAPVAVSAAPMPFEKFFARKALHAAHAKAASVPSPVDASEANLLAGARIYRSACAVCHNLPEAHQTRFQRGMYPPPPDLLSGDGVTDDPVGITHWVVRNGIRMSGMPAFEGAYSDTELWQVSLLLAHAHDLPPAVQHLLAQPDAVPVQDTASPAAGK